MTDLDACRNDVRAFLGVLSWPIAAVEVRLWTSDGLPLGFRKWGPDTTDLWKLAEEIAHFITDGVVSRSGASCIWRPWRAFAAIPL